ncbi:hypothetical protein C8Q74DRAFT_1319566 [Fomes fomentarius]|nr:hypothetical protein C8Q74DRAFT_1319566 [Fomes fomentarius]
MLTFVKNQVESSRPDGYWIEAFPFRVDDTCGQNLVGSGLGTSEQASQIEMFLNPYKDNESSGKDWPKTQIADLQFPVAFSYADITGNKYTDIILSDRYGPLMDGIWPEGGRVSWFENTGDPNTANWKQRYIGRSPGMHRLRSGHFTTKDKVQIIAVPIVVKSSDLTTPPPVIIYTAPDDPTSPEQDGDKGWEESIPYPSTFRLVHEVTGTITQTIIPGANSGLDQVLLAGREGVNLLWYDVDAAKWEYQNIGEGLPQQPGNPYWGSESVDIAKVDGDSTGYIARSEAFHGNHVAVYIKEQDAPKNQLKDVKWTRHVLDDFGSLYEGHVGSIHHIVCADIDGDGVEETLVAMMGSDPPSWERTGVWCYTQVHSHSLIMGYVAETVTAAVDLVSGKFNRFKLSDNSAGRIAVADLMCRGKLVLEFLDVASRRLALVVVPPHAKYAIDNGEGLKVIAGRVIWTDSEGHRQERTIATAPFTQVSTVGAVFVLLRQSSTSGHAPYTDMEQLVAHNIFPSQFPEALRHLEFPWIKVEERPWANGGFKGLEFYNLVGFHVRYNDDSDEKVCHIQAWTAGVGVSAGFHNHVDQNFCEIHACIVNGTGQGGMSWATVPDDEFDPAQTDKDKYESIVVPDMSEHGPLWRTDKDGLPILRKNDTVDYPWHAWLAGGGVPGQQRFDVWLAFEFPPFVARAEVVDESHTPPPGFYSITHAGSQLALSVSGGSSSDNTPLAVTDEAQKWTVSKLPGTSFRTLTNDSTRSSATVFWPPKSGQKVVGSRTPARLELTSA